MSNQFIVMVDGKGVQGRYDTMEEAGELVRHLRSIGMWAYIMS